MFDLASSKIQIKISVWIFFCLFFEKKEPSLLISQSNKILDLFFEVSHNNTFRDLGFFTIIV